MLDDNNEKVSRQSSEYSRLKISCDHQNIVITNNTINFLSENGTYNIDVEYYGQIKHFQIFLNIEINSQQQEYQVLFNQQWYDESLSKLTSIPNILKFVLY